MTKFYKRTNGFWKVSRILLILLFIYPLFKVAGNKSFLSSILNASCGIYLILMILILINRISEKRKGALRKWTGFLSIFYGLVMSIFLIKLELKLDVIVTSYYQVLPIWIILFGIWELNSIRLESK